MKKVALVLLGLIFFSGVVLADQSCQPGFPVEFKGDIYVDDGWLGIGASELLTGEHSLIVTVGGLVSGNQIVTGSSYAIDVSPCYGTGSGEIKFVVNGVEAKETAEYLSENFGKTFELDLTLRSWPTSDTGCGDNIINSGEECDDGNALGNDGCSSICEVEYGYSCVGQPSVCEITAFCGDGIINNGETCETCVADVGACNSGNNDNSGSGSKGSSSSSSSDEPYSKETPINDSSDDSPGVGIQQLNTLESNAPDEVRPSGFFSMITGAVVGGNARWGISIVVILVAGGAYWFVRYKRKEGTGKKSKK